MNLNINWRTNNIYNDHKNKLIDLFSKLSINNNNKPTSDYFHDFLTFILCLASPTVSRPKQTINLCKRLLEYIECSKPIISKYKTKYQALIVNTIIELLTLKQTFVGF